MGQLLKYQPMWSQISPKVNSFHETGYVTFLVVPLILLAPLDDTSKFFKCFEFGNLNPN
jgi:hypothetical protein